MEVQSLEHELLLLLLLYLRLFLLKKYFRRKTIFAESPALKCNWIKVQCLGKIVLVALCAVAKVFVGETTSVRDALNFPPPRLMKDNSRNEEKVLSSSRARNATSSGLEMYNMLESKLLLITSEREKTFWEKHLHHSPPLIIFWDASWLAEKTIKPTFSQYTKNISNK